MRLPTNADDTNADDREFTHIPDEIHHNIWTLERECAVYADFWIDEIDDFRHVKIDFSKEEREDYIRRSWAFELFLRAGSPALAADVPGIDPQVAHDADTYTMRLADGTELPPPYHCFAGFLGAHLEKLVCSVTDSVTVIDLKGKELVLFETIRTINALPVAIRSFNDREKSLEPWTITCEDDVRDLLYVMLRPRIPDITKEEAIPSSAGSYKIGDLCSKSVPFLIELKWISRKGTWNQKIKEIYEDIQTYWRHPSCDNLIFVIVDSVGDFRDPRQIEEDLTNVQLIDGRQMNVRAIIVEHRNVD